ncbi:MAG: gamma-glutamyltransferase [Cellvibrionales bacterium]|nr:gamma-glutamyltransferase [Cellvibrionales bacterium]
MGKIYQTDGATRRVTHPLFLSIALVFSCFTSGVYAVDDNIHPEVASKKKRVLVAKSQTGMVITANDYATQAASDTILKGGSAVDAAIAAQLVLGLVEPQSSGIGGGGFLLHYDSKKKQLKHFNGRETAPMAVNEDHFMVAKNKAYPFFDALVGGYAVGTPGLVAMMYNAHKQYGKLPWASLFEPAILLASNGFIISNRLHDSLKALAKSPKGVSNKALAALYFQTNGEPKPVGSILRNPQLANTYSEIANKGPKAFYQGTIGQDIVQAVKNDSNKKGLLNKKDLIRYQSLIETPLCKNIGNFKFCGSPPPSSGPFTVTQMVELLAKTPELKGLAYDSPGFYHRFIEAAKLSFADRNTYIADPRFTKNPTKALLSPGYTEKRAKLIPLLKASDELSVAGDIDEVDYLQVKSPNQPSTTHLSIVDKEGNIVSMTTSIEHAFGSRIQVRGFLLNNQLTDFSFTPINKNNEKIANRIEPGKMPRSSMSPMIIFNEKDQPILVIGSPGGAWIIPYVAKTITQHLYLGASLEDAIESPHIANTNRLHATIEDDAPDSLKKTLEMLGHEFKQRPLTSGIHAIKIHNGFYTGVADSRREGTAKGL